MDFRRLRGFGSTSKKQLRQRNEKQRRSYVARQYEHLLFEPLEWRNLMTVSLAPIAGNDANQDFNIPSGKVLYVPLTGVDAGNTVSYTANSTNSNVQLNVLDGNPTLVLNVTGTRAGGGTFTGTLTIDLFEDIAPLAVDRISDLAESGAYNGKNFYRVIQDFMIQGGLGNSGPVQSPFADEFSSLFTFNSPGLLAMANPGDPDANTSEFFITDIDRPTANTPQYLNFVHTIFGQLTSGFDTYKDIIGVTVGGSNGTTPTPAVTITSASIIEAGDQSAILQVIVPNDFTGTSEITVTATSSDSTTAMRTFGIDAAPDTTPSISKPLILDPVTNKTTTAGTQIQFEVSTRKFTGTSLGNFGVSFSVTGGADFRGALQNVTAQVTDHGDTATITLTPAPGFSGTLNLILHADSDTGALHDAMAFTLEVLPPPEINPVDPINIATGDTITVSGTGTPDAMISVEVTDGTNSVTGMATVDDEGNWTTDLIDITSLNQGEITYKATDTTNDVEAEEVAGVKDTVAPSVEIDPIDFVNNVNAGSFTVTGTSEPFAVIMLVISGAGADDVTPPTVEADENGDWTVSNIDLTEFTDGTLTFTATAVDAAGNPGEAEATEEATKDIEAPDVEITDATDPVTLGTVTSASINGTAEEGANITVTVTDGTNTTSAEMTTATGETWSFNDLDLSGLNDGPITYTVTARDEAGNETTVTLDADKTVLGVSFVTDPINVGNQNSVEIRGTSEESAEIEVEIMDEDGTTITVDTTVAEGSTTWEITGIDLSDFDDGTIEFKVTATKNGNSAVLTRTATKDTVAPTISIDPITGFINGNNDNNFSVSGDSDAENGSTVTLVISDGDDEITVTGTVMGGAWTIDNIDLSDLNDGSLTFTATVKDAAGNDSAEDIETATKDTAAPTVTISSVTNPVTPGNQASASISGNITGTGNQNTTITVVINDNSNATPPRTVTVNADGSWTINNIDVSSLDDGEITYTVTATDMAGNESAPVTHTATKSVADNSISGFVYVDSNKNNRKDSRDAVLSGILITLTGVDLDGNPLPSQTTTTRSDGSYRFTNLAPGRYTIREAQPSNFNSAVSNAGSLGGVAGTNVISRIVVIGGQNGRNYNFGERLKTTQVSINDFLASTPSVQTRFNRAVASGTTAAPVVQSIVKLDSDPTDDSQVRYRVTFNKSVTGVNASDFRVISNGTIDDASIDGVSGRGKTYTVTVNTGVGSGQLGLALRDNDSIKDSKNKALGGNGAGNGNFVSASYTVAKVSFVQITSNIPTINAANDNSVPVGGTGEVGATVTVVARNGTMVTDERTTTVGAGGTWSIPDFDVSGLPDGTIVFSATATNQTGASAPSNRNATKDTVAPTVTIDPISETINGNDAGSFEVSGTVDGTGDEDTTITLVIDDNDDMTPAVERTVTVDSDGAWTIDDIDISDLDDGSLTFTVKATDAAGNDSAEDMETATKDTVAPAVTMDQPDTINAETDETSITVTGTGEIGATIRLTISNGSATVGPLDATVGSDGIWSITANLSTLPDGELTFFATATDDAQNPATATRKAVKDTDAPDVMSITLADADPTSALTVHFTVVFSEAVTDVGTGSFMTVPGGDVTGVTIDGVSGTGNIYTVTVSFTSGAGTLGLNVVDTDLIFDLANNPLGGVGNGNGDFTGPAYTIEASGGAAEALLAGSDDESADEFFGELASA